MRLAHLVLAATFAVPALASAPVLASAQTTTTSTATSAGTKMAPNASNAAAAAKASSAGTSGMPDTAPNSGGMTKGGSGDVGQYASESAATSACAGDTVVWANATSKALHMSGDRYFGKSKHGFYTCEKQAMAGGYHVAGHRGSHKHSKTA